MERKRYVGIDVSKDKLNAAYEQPKAKGKFKVKKHIFTNGDKGFQELLKWSKHGIIEGESICYIMEATGNYHEGIATYLYDQGEVVNVENPGRVHAFCKSAGIRTKTDEKDAVALIQFGKAFDLKAWSPPPLEYRELQQYYRAIEMRNKERTAIINRIKSFSNSLSTPSVLLEEEKALLNRVEESIEKMKEAIRSHLKEHPGIEEEVKYVDSITGIGWLTAVLLVSTMAGGSRFKNAKAAAAYLGLNVRESKSGKSVHGKSCLSKEGPAEVRKALYWPAVSASRYNPDVRNLYNRLLKKGKAKMTAIGAAMRKLVHIAYGVLKHRTEYKPQVSEI